MTLKQFGLLIRNGMRKIETKIGDIYYEEGEIK